MRKQFKELRKQLKLSSEQADAWEAFLANLPEEPYKSFDNKEEFEDYVKTQVSKYESDLTKEVLALKLEKKELGFNSVLEKHTKDSKKQATIKRLIAPDLTGDIDNSAYEKLVKQAMKDYFIPADSAEAPSPQPVARNYGTPAPAPQAGKPTSTPDLEEYIRLGNAFLKG